MCVITAFCQKPSQKQDSVSRMNIADKISLRRDNEVHEMLMAQVYTKNLKRIFKVSREVASYRLMFNGAALHQLHHYSLAT